MELENLTYEQIEPFFNSLGDEEKHLLGIPLEYILRADFVCGVHADNELAGITGYVKSYRLIPSSFDVVASRFQGQGFGNTLHQKRLDFARGHYNFAVSSITNPETHQASLHLYLKYGYRQFYRKSDSVFLCISLSKKGAFVCKFLPFIYCLFVSLAGLPLIKQASHFLYSVLLTRQDKNDSK